MRARLVSLSSTLSLGLAAFACLPAQGGRESAPGPSLSSTDAPDAGPAKTKTGEGEAGAGEARAADAQFEEPEPEPAVAQPEPEQPEPPPEVDSQLVTGRFLAADAQPGLLEFSQAVAQPGALWVGKLEGNGGRDVLIYIPPGADDAAPFELIYHFHGTYSEHVEAKREGLAKKKWVGWDRLEQTMAAAAQLQAERDHNVALIYPFSAGKRIEPWHRGWHNAAYDRMWMDPAQPPDFRDSFDRLHAEVVEVLVDSLGAHPSKIRTPVLAEGHSAGGMALRNIAVVGTQLVGEYLFLDAGFQGWSDVAYEALQTQGSKAVLTMVITEGGIADPLAGRTPWCVSFEAHAQQWAEARGWCAEHEGEAEPRGADADCETLEEDAELWVHSEQWCRDMAEDMRSVPRVNVVRTRVHHGDQPRRFTGGLGLNAAHDGERQAAGEG